MSPRKKKYILILPISIATLYLIKLFHLQIIDQKYTEIAKSNFVKITTEPALRGLIYDRNEQILAKNSPVYDILAPPKSLKNIDLQKFCNHLNIPIEDLTKSLEKAKKRSNLHPFTIIENIPYKQWATIQENLDTYPFLTIRVRLIRQYPHPIMANTLGYIAEINATQINTPNHEYYTTGDLIGTTGLEKQYETDLRGTKGKKYTIVNANGLEQSPFAHGKDDQPSIPGANITTTIDLDLQRYGEFLIKNKKGCIVAIEPATGEILAIISSPSYDPNLLSGKDLPNNFTKLSKDPTAPLFNRPIMATYPPGSIFKMIQALISLQLNIITQNTHFPCDTSYIKCHPHPPNLTLLGAIEHSCNPYFGAVFKRLINRHQSKDSYTNTRLGIDAWSEYVTQLGFGKKLGIDIPEEKPGFIPNTKLYDQIYKNKNWKLSTIRSLDIGQGELLITPLQMANLAATIANRGHYYRPHIVKKIGNKNTTLTPQDRFDIPIDPKYFDLFATGMEKAAQTGTAQRANVPGLHICAKTGTAENPHGKDHSVCIAFAPKENPKIAIATYIENSGWGGRAAAAITGLMIELYLTRKITRTNTQEYVIKGDFD